MRSIESIEKEIDNEIVRLIELKSEIRETMSVLNCLKNAIPISKSSYDKLCFNKEVKDDVLYYIVKPEIGKYIDSYIG